MIGNQFLEVPNIEWKEIWKDDYLAWICGFAAQQT